MKHKSIPKFKSEKDEQEFWSNNDSTDYIDWSKAKVGVFPNLKPSTETISVRLPKSLLDALKVAANRRDVPYQSFLKILLIQGLDMENTVGNRKHRIAQKIV